MLNERGEPTVWRHAEGSEPGPVCYDCRRPYGTWPDMLVSDDIWEQINPTENRGCGLLCPTCIAVRCRMLGLDDVPASFQSFPLVSGVVASRPGERIVVRPAINENAALDRAVEVAAYAQVGAARFGTAAEIAAYHAACRDIHAALRDAGYEIVQRDQRRDDLTKAERAVLEAVRNEPAYDTEIAERAGIRTVRPAETAAKHLRALQRSGLVEKVAGTFGQERWRLSSPTTEGQP